MRKLARMVGVAIVFWGASAYAWGPAGHRIIADVAAKNLNVGAKAAVKALLGPDVSLADIANFADSPYRNDHPETYNWHFVDIPLEATNYDPARDCKLDPQRGDCVIAALDREIAILQDHAQAADDRLLALKLVVHLVGDEHQPLHTENHNDKGGNAVAVHWFGKTTNLHAVWDSAIIAETGLSEQGYAGQLNANLTKSQKKAAQVGNDIDWALEAHKAAHDVAYANLPAASGGFIELGDGYYQAALGTVDLQMMRAGLRLAAVLNQALGREKPAQAKTKTP